MHRSPLAILALAAALLCPATLCARSRYIRLPAPPRHLAASSHHLVARPEPRTHAQHPQPAAFQHPPRQTSHASHAYKGRTPQRSTSIHSYRDRSPSRRSAPTHSGRLLHARYHPGQREPRLPVNRRALLEPPTSDLDNPAQPTPVVSIIRPNSDHPQLPPVQQAAADPIILPALYDERGRLVVPAPLLGSREILLHQNAIADQDGLGRVQDDADLDGMRARGMLVALPAGDNLHIDDRLPANRRFCRPWTAQFLTSLSRAFYAQFHTPLQVNSAVRTVAFQLRLQRINGNAAPAEGDTASPHLTGQAVDIAKRGLTLPQIAWLRGYLLPLIQSGRLDVEEEFQQSCFHISVYRSYLPSENLPPRYAVTSRSTSALAAALR